MAIFSSAAVGGCVLGLQLVLDFIATILNAYIDFFLFCHLRSLVLLTLEYFFLFNIPYHFLQSQVYS
ncbi:transmembrane protein, putative [Medicago truncatula]|uniref:Transmembrane protein, putative n=1 Tax=Medicago truncatula TaxID=3880 RepID=G7J3F8_MEDTR|nr:transmembrane protein, putative [Medicago truncatula]